MIKFEISRFAEEFKNTVNWMLEKEYAENIKEDLRYFKNNKNILETNPDSLDALRVILELVKTKSWHLKKPVGFDSAVDSFIRNHGGNFRTSTAKEELVRLVGNRMRANIEWLLNYPSIKEFTNNLHELAKQGKTEVMGKKGRDNYLRDFGYWDRVPIDRHEMRFIIRTGIYHTCSAKSQSDPLEKSHLQDALTRFCTQYLRRYIVEEIDLGEAPGVVDLFIWSYSAEKRYNICGKNPSCERCYLKSVCSYTLK